MANAKVTSDVTEAELAVLQMLWHMPMSPIREIMRRLYPAGTQSDYATVQKLLERLEQKGCVERDASEVPHRFSAAIARRDLIGRRLREMADKLCGGSVAPLVTSLVESHALTPSEIDELRELIDRLDQSPKPPAKKRR
jgi:predicted transcriptional regulator